MQTGMSKNLAGWQDWLEMEREQRSLCSAGMEKLFAVNPLLQVPWRTPRLLQGMLGARDGSSLAWPRKGERVSAAGSALSPRQI